MASATEEGAADGNIVQLGPSDSKDTDLSASAIKVASETDESATVGNIVQPASVLNVRTYAYYANNISILHRSCLMYNDLT